MAQGRFCERPYESEPMLAYQSVQVVGTRRRASVQPVVAGSGIRPRVQVAGDQRRRSDSRIVIAQELRNPSGMRARGVSANVCGDPPLRAR